MLCNPWSRIKGLQHDLARERQYVDQLRLRIHANIAAYLVIQRELSYAHAALRRKNKQLKNLKASVELHKEYTKLHPPETTR